MTFETYKKQKRCSPPLSFSVDTAPRLSKLLDDDNHKRLKNLLKVKNVPNTLKGKHPFVVKKSKIFLHRVLVIFNLINNNTRPYANRGKDRIDRLPIILNVEKGVRWVIRSVYPPRGLTTFLGFVLFRLKIYILESENVENCNSFQYCRSVGTLVLIFLFCTKGSWECP